MENLLPGMSHQSGVIRKVELRDAALFRVAGVLLGRDIAPGERLSDTEWATVHKMLAAAADARHATVSNATPSPDAFEPVD